MTLLRSVIQHGDLPLRAGAATYRQTANICPTEKRLGRIDRADAVAS